MLHNETKAHKKKLESKHRTHHLRWKCPENQALIFLYLRHILKKCRRSLSVPLAGIMDRRRFTHETFQEISAASWRHDPREKRIERARETEQERAKEREKEREVCPKLEADERRAIKLVLPVAHRSTRRDLPLNPRE